MLLLHTQPATAGGRLERDERKERRSARRSDARDGDGEWAARAPHPIAAQSGPALQRDEGENGAQRDAETALRAVTTAKELVGTTGHPGGEDGGAEVVGCDQGARRPKLRSRLGISLCSDDQRRGRGQQGDGRDQGKERTSHGHVPRLPVGPTPLDAPDGHARGARTLAADGPRQPSCGPRRARQRVRGRR